jgi:hypothetical protein
MKTQDKIFLVALVVLLWVFITWNPFVSKVENTTDKKIDSLITEIKHESKKIDSLNIKIAQIQDSLITIDSVLQDNQVKLINLRKQYEKNISLINKFSSNGVSAYFTNRYNNK